MGSGSIIILGATPASEALIATLNRYGHQLTLVDPNESLLLKISSRYDINTICEYPSYPNTLALAGTAKADALIALTPSDETNLIACHVAKSQSAQIECITSLQHTQYAWGQTSPRYAEPIDSALSSTLSVFEDIKNLIKHPGFRHINHLGAKFVSASFNVSDDSSFIGMTLGEANQLLPKNMILAGLYRQNGWVKFRRNIKITENDTLLLVSSINNLSHHLFAAKSIQNILLMGVSELTAQVCDELSEYDITVIEPSQTLCNDFAMQHPNITIINDDPLDKPLLLSLGIKKAITIACGSDDEDNLVYSYQAKDAQGYKVFTLLNHMREGHIFEQGPIDYTINAPQILCDEILRDLLKSQNFLNFYTKQNYLQIASLLINNTHPFCHKKIWEIKLPAETFVGCVIRDNHPMFTEKSTQILPHDQIVLYSNHTKHADNPLESMFLSPSFLFHG